MQLVGFHIQQLNDALTLCHGGGKALPEPLIILLLRNQLIYHNLHVVVLVAVQLHAGNNFPNLTVHPDTQIAFSANILKKFFVMTLARLDHRCQEQDLPTLVFIQDKVYNLVLRIAHHLLSAQVRIGLTGTGKEQTEIIVNLCRGSYSGTGILIGGLLLDGDDGAQSGNLVHVRTLHIAQEIAGIGGESLNIPTLSLRKNGIESQRGLSTAT